MEHRGGGPAPEQKEVPYMTIEPIGSSSVALYITPADLNQRGLTPQSITLEEALHLARQAFEEAGIATDGAIEIEAYPDVCGVLVFARVQPGGSSWFSFDGLEEVLAAAHAIAGPWPDAALTLWDGRYWLRLEGGDERMACCLSEFGRPELPSPHFDARLAEHGSVLIPADAFSVLVHHFG